MNMTEDLRIRYATALDNILLAELGAETFIDSFAADNTPKNLNCYSTAAFSPEKQAQELADPVSKFLIAENDEAVVGYARLKSGPAPEAVSGSKPMEIARFYARKAWIRKGVGTRLMKACLGEAKQADCDVVWLGVWKRNLQAIAFYRKWGFSKVGTQVFQLGDDAQRDWLMARTV
jgi:diamine N-acetyltransferase